MEAAAKGQRRKGHREPVGSSVIHVGIEDSMGNSRYVIANLIDVIGGGCGLALMTPLRPGSTVVLRGKFGENHSLDYLKAGVKWCTGKTDGTYRAGLEFIDHGSTFALDQEQSDRKNPVALDCYEVMQLSPNADAETISRVYRMLAFRYHPDNLETGNSEMFLRLSEAHEILSDPEKRARYDAAQRGGQRFRAPEKQRNIEAVTAAYLGLTSLEANVSWEG
jgi:hypothetical protein